MVYGFLRETKEEAIKAGIDSTTGLPRTGLEEYLKVIFPDVDDWIHDKPFGGNDKELSRKRPDYRSESLKLIIEFDGLPHYQNPKQILEDSKRTKLYSDHGYKVVRIPYFIQLTKRAVKTLFGIDLSFELFDETIPSLGIKNNATPAFLCIDGIKRMAHEFALFPEQYYINLNYLKNIKPEDYYLTGVEVLEYFYNN